MATKKKLPPNEKLRDWRTKVANITQADAGGRLNPVVTAATWCDWESGTKIPSLHSAKDLEEVTGGAVTLDEWIAVSRDAADERAAKREQQRKAAS